MCNIKRYKFDVKRALEGEEVITRSGLKGKVKKRYPDLPLNSSPNRWNIDISDIVDVDKPYCDQSGWFSTIDQNHDYDLFMMISPSEYKKQVELSESLTESKPVVEKEETKMASTPVKTKTSVLIEKNKAAAIQAAKLEMGQIAVNRIVKLVQPKLPMMLRGYADTAVARIVVANLFTLAVQQYAPENEKAEIIADAMMQGAMVEFVKSFNIEQIIEQVTKGVDFTRITGAESEE